MQTSKRFAHVHGIIPPYMLEALAQSSQADPAARAAAQQSIALTSALRAQEEAFQASLRAGVRVTPTGPSREVRLAHTAEHGTRLPGRLVRSEGQPPVSDPAVDECYDWLGATFDFYDEVLGRNSIDGAGMSLIATLHYSRSYVNAFWNGTQMVFGDGDGVYFNRFTVPIDVTAHELAHGVMSYTADLEYSRQSGALNESISDVFGSLVKQYQLKQSAADADWLIGAGIFTSKVHGVALRSMKAPGTAYDDPILRRDPQPADMAHYKNMSEDNGGVHVNSGIPNRAFYLAAVALGGYAWERAGRIWYATLCDSRLARTAKFQDFANLTVDNAVRLYDPRVSDAVVQAWEQVGITVVRLAAAA